MPLRKTAIAVPQDVLDDVDRLARLKGESRSGFITRVLRLADVDGKRLEITIPPGADTGTRIRLSGKGPGGGDLYVVVRQQPDATFMRKGADLEREVPVTLEEALLGAEVPVRSPKGTVLLRIPPGTQPGRQFRLRGRGMPKFRGEGHGDLYVRAKVVLPTDLGDDAEKAAKRFLDLVDQPDPR